MIDHFQAMCLGQILSLSQFPHLPKGDDNTMKIAMTTYSARTLVPVTGWIISLS